MATTTQPVQVLSWSEFKERFTWEQGEHVTLIGPTKSGKSTLAHELLVDASRGSHPWQAVFATKRRDPIIDDFRSDGYQRIPEWIVTDPDLYPKVILHHPMKKGVRSIDDQREVFRVALESLFRQGGWLCYLDELRHIVNFLGLERDVELLWHQGRSEGISVVSGVQRPRHVPLMAYDQATHLFLWETRDSTMAKRLSEIGGKVDPEVVRAGVSVLQSHQFMYVNPTTGDVFQSKVEL